MIDSETQMGTAPLDPNTPQPDTAAASEERAGIDADTRSMDNEPPETEESIAPAGEPEEVEPMEMEPTEMEADAGADAAGEPEMEELATDEGTSDEAAEHIPGRLALVGVPVGNLDDITVRGVRTLDRADVIVCSDYKAAARLLRAHNISKKILSPEEDGNLPNTVVGMLRKGKVVAVMAEDPATAAAHPFGDLLRAVRALGVRPQIVPGPGRLAAALAASGFALEEYHVVGYLPRHPSERRRAAEELAAHPHALVIQETPNRLRSLLDALSAVMPGRGAALAINLSTPYETVIQGTVASLLAKYTERRFKGEFVLVLDEVSETAATSAAVTDVLDEEFPDVFDEAGMEMAEGAVEDTGWFKPKAVRNEEEGNEDVEERPSRQQREREPGREERAGGGWSPLRRGPKARTGGQERPRRDDRRRDDTRQGENRPRQEDDRRRTPGKPAGSRGGFNRAGSGRSRDSFGGERDSSRGGPRGEGRGPGNRSERSFGERPRSERSFGERPRGERSFGERPRGERSFGERPRGERSFGERPRGERSFGERPRGERSFGERPRGERSFGERPRGERPFGERPYGERPNGDRSGNRQSSEGRESRGGFGKRNDRRSDGGRPSFGGASGGRSFSGRPPRRPGGDRPSGGNRGPGHGGRGKGRG